MDWNQFFTWAFQALLTGVVVYGVSVLSRMSTSIEALNVHIATLLEKTNQHEKVLDRHEQAIEQLKSH